MAGSLPQTYVNFGLSWAPDMSAGTNVCVYTCSSHVPHMFLTCSSVIYNMFLTYRRSNGIEKIYKPCESKNEEHAAKQRGTCEEHVRNM